MSSSTSTEGPKECSNEQKCQAKPGCDDTCPDSNNPVNLANGSMSMQEYDIDSGIPGLTHGRIFRNNFTENQTIDLPNGFNWQTQEWCFINKRTLSKTGSPDKITINARMGSNQVRFVYNGSEYIAQYGDDDIYSLEEKPSENAFILTKRSNAGVEICKFHDFNQVDELKGRMISRRLSTGQVITVSRNGSYQVTKLSTTRTPTSGSTVTYDLDYTYHTSGANIGKLSQVDLTSTPNGGSTSTIRRVQYTYYDGTTNTDWGSLNDLESAQIQVPNGGGWNTIDLFYYRYYTQQGTNKGVPFAQRGGYIHGLRYVMGSSAYADLVQAGCDPLGISGTVDTTPDLVPQYAEHYFEYDNAHRVVYEKAQNCATCASSAGTGDQGDRITRTNNPNYPEDSSFGPGQRYNVWQKKSILTSGIGYRRIVYTNRSDQIILEVKQETAAGKEDRKWITYYRYDETDGRPLMKAYASAVKGFDEDLDDLVGYESDTAYIHLSSDTGLVEWYEYGTTTNANENTAGDVLGYRKAKYVSEGVKPSSGRTQINSQLYKASKNSSGTITSPVDYYVASRSTYPDAIPGTPGRDVTTLFDQTYSTSGDSVTLSERITTLPEIEVGHSDSSEFSYIRESFDADGQLTWRQDEHDILTKFSYDDRGNLIQEIRNHDVTGKPGSWPNPPANSNGESANVTIDHEYDDRSRRTLTLGPLHNAITSVGSNTAADIRTATYYSYSDGVLSNQALWGQPDLDRSGMAPGYRDDSTDHFVGPAVINLNDKRGRTMHSITSARTGSDTAAFDVSESTKFERGLWSRWSRLDYDAKGFIECEFDYFNIPSQNPDLGLNGVNSDQGAKDVNYYTTQYGYCKNCNQKVRTVSRSGTVTRQKYDGMERASATYVGTNDQPDGPADLARNWPLSRDTIANGQATDTVGPAGNATLVGLPSPTQYALGPAKAKQGALHLDGSGYLSSPFVLNPSSSPVTISMWIQMEALLTGGNQVILSQQDGSGLGRSWLTIENSTNRVFSFLGGANTSTSASLEALTWVHVALTYDGTTLRIYLDGGQAASAARTAESATGGLILGSNKNGAANFVGNMAEVSVYSRALSASEIQSLAGAPEGITNWTRWKPDAPGTDLVMTSSQEYDEGKAGGLSNLTKSLAHTADSSSRISTYEYDYRNRQISMGMGDPTPLGLSHQHVKQDTTYDNMDRAIVVARFADPDSSFCISYEEIDYNDRSQATETRRFEVNPDTGALPQSSDPKLTGTMKYDASGNVIEETPQGAGVLTTYTTIDNLDRTVKTETGYLDDTHGWTPAESSESVFNDASQETEQHQLMLDSGRDASNASYRTSYMFFWYDTLGRSVASANHGALGSVPTRNNTIDTRSDTVLVMTQNYDDKGRLQSTIDPKDLESRREYDDLGRVTKTIANYTTSATPSVDVGVGYLNTVDEFTPFAHWRLDETSGVTATDRSGSNNGTYLPNSSGSWQGGYLDNPGPIANPFTGDLPSVSPEFDGSSGYVNVGSLGTLGSTLGNGFSISIWFKNDSTDWTSLFGVFSGSDSPTQPTITIELNRGPSGQQTGSIQAFLADNSYDRLRGYSPSNSEINDGQWHHLVVSMNGDTDTIVMLLDGEEKSITYINQENPDHFPTNFATPLMIGTNSNDVGNPVTTRCFGGLIGEVAIYNAVLSSAQGLRIYNAGTRIDSVNQKVSFTYHPSGQKATETAHQPGDAQDQVTTYTYGVSLSGGSNGSRIATNDLLAQVAYPDSSGGSDIVSYAYNRQGDVIVKTDQAGTVHNYWQDSLGRQVHDIVTKFATGSEVVTSPCRLSTRYNRQGLPSHLTSHASKSRSYVDQVMNTVQMTYNGFDQLIKDEQEHDGSPDASTPAVQYAYADPSASGTENLTYLTKLTYPSGREVDYKYGSSGNIDEKLNRLTRIELEASNVSSTAYCDYTYLGLSTFVRTHYTEPDVMLDHWGGTAGTYTGLDRFDRVTDHPWIQDPSGTPTDMVHLTYGYDRNSNRTYREDLVAKNTYSKNFDELYEYDGLNRLADFQRGKLNTAKDGVDTGTLTYHQRWGLDPLGNWATFDENDDPATAGTTLDDWTMNQARLVNPVNEITAIRNTLPSASNEQWVTPDYDARGNMTTMPQPENADVLAQTMKGEPGGSPTEAFEMTYDAWNRPVCMILPNYTPPNSPNIFDKKLVQYQYDARNFLITEQISDTPSNNNKWTETLVGGASGTYTNTALPQNQGREFSLDNTGGNISGTSDSLLFVQKPMDGDGEIIAELKSVTSNGSNTRAGLMIRESDGAGGTDADAVFVAILSDGTDMILSHRATTGGSVNETVVAGIQYDIIRLLFTSGNVTAWGKTSSRKEWFQIGASSSVTSKMLLMAGNVAVNCENKFWNTYIERSVQHYFYSQKWQRLENQKYFGDTTIVPNQYLWGIQYVDFCISTDSYSGSVAERLYSLPDNTISTSSIISFSSNWSVSQRLIYVPYGQTVFYDPAFNEADNIYDWIVKYHGILYDNTVNIALNRYRIHNNTIGSFCQRDMIGSMPSVLPKITQATAINSTYIDSFNLYQYLRGNANRFNDPLGLSCDCIDTALRMYQNDWWELYEYYTLQIVRAGGDSDELCNPKSLAGAIARSEFMKQVGIIDGLRANLLKKIADCQAEHCDCNDGRLPGDVMSSVPHEPFQCIGSNPNVPSNPSDSDTEWYFEDDWFIPVP